MWLAENRQDLTARGARTLTVCNACRYCEQYCPVFPAMEERTSFSRVDLAYLANLCHNCGECLYACQYAPPHEFGIDVPRRLAEIRVASYEDYAWPRFLARMFRRHSVFTASSLVITFSVWMLLVARTTGLPVQRVPPGGDFYAIIPHAAMVALFGSVFAFVVLAMAIGLTRFLRDARGRSEDRQLRTSAGGAVWRALRDGVSLRHLHGNGADCVAGEEQRPPWRRWWHHVTLWGFLLCFASTSVAAIYHSVFGWVAPHAYTSAPVVLGSLGGVALLAGCAGLWTVRAGRDPALADPAQDGLDRSFIVLLFVTSLTGLALLELRESFVMGRLLALHLGAVMALFVTLPYGKFVHGFYRLAALWVYERERT
ncbi:MAG TPA: tricarballylate utilization 4Fe-4S protein TcuB [Vicinamibacterales bacterium]|nr:tricarballylate utilization 4Fe-4S protein TcuB [Vicinamibacterales bacterium]